MNTLVELGSFLREIGMLDEDVEAVIASAEGYIDGTVAGIRSLLETAVPEDTAPSQFCDCGRSNYEHYQQFFGSPEAEAELRAQLEARAVANAEMLMMFASMPGIILG